MNCSWGLWQYRRQQIKWVVHPAVKLCSNIKTMVGDWPTPHGQLIGVNARDPTARAKWRRAIGRKQANQEQVEHQT